MRVIWIGIVSVSTLASQAARAQAAPAAAIAETPKPMAADAHPSFEVATIKPHDPASHHSGWEVAGNRVGMFDYSVAQLIAFSYSINRRQIVNGPGWIGDDRYDVDGKSDAQIEPNLTQQREMIQKLLADRFNLRFHREKRELPVYAIRIARGGPKLVAARDPSASPQEHSEGHGFETTQTYTSADLAYFILVRQLFADRPLVDQTGLTGRYDFKLNYSYNETDSTPAPNAPPGLFTAIQEQLGLKLQPTKALVDVFVIDHVDPPSPN